MEGCLARGLALALLLPSLARADLVNNEWMSTTRSQSMGNIGIASAEDAASATFYNPAALARTKKSGGELANPQFEMGTGVLKTSSGFEDYGKHSNLNTVKPLLQKKPGTGSFLGFSLFPNVYSQNFSFGILFKAEGGSYFDSASQSVTYRSRWLLIPTLGISMSALGGRFRLGAAVRGIQATENDRTVSVNAANIGYTVDPREGFGVGLDVGTLFTFPWAMLPTFGFVARNVGDTSFPSGALVKFGSGTPTAHEKIKKTYDAGFSLAPKFGQRDVLTLAVDYRDLLDLTGVDKRRKLNFGFEFAFRRALFFRAGVSRGYWTAGLGLATKAGTFDLGTYAEELDSKKFRVIEDRRISLRFGSRF